MTTKAKHQKAKKTRKRSVGKQAPGAQMSGKTKAEGNGLLIVSYEEIIRARAAEISEGSKQDPDTPERIALRQEQDVAFVRMRIAEWQALGNHYADVLEDPRTPAELRTVINDELDEQAATVCFHLTSPEILRLLYPLLRLRLLDRQQEEKGGRRR